MPFQDPYHSHRFDQLTIVYDVTFTVIFSALHHDRRLCPFKTTPRMNIINKYVLRFSLPESKENVKVMITV